MANTHIVRGRRESTDVFEVETPGGHRLTAQAGGASGQEPTAGPAPMELMLASLVTCAGTTIDSILTKMRLAVPALNVVAEGRRADEIPRVFTEIVLEFQVASEAPVDRLQRAIELTERTCSASAMLSRVADVSPRLVQVETVDPSVTRALRRTVLRPHQSIDELAAEENPATTWFAARRDGEVVGSGSIVAEPAPDDVGAAAFRLRAMAVSPDMRGRGLGRVLLGAALDTARRSGATQVWCSARAPARDFYLRAGFRETSGTYEVEHVGPHVRMALDL